MNSAIMHHFKLPKGYYKTIIKCINNIKANMVLTVIIH